MNILSKITEVGKKVFALTQSTEENKKEIEKQKKQTLELIKYVKKLKAKVVQLEAKLVEEKQNNKHQLEFEQQKYKSLEEKYENLEQQYELKFINLKLELSDKLNDFEKMLLRSENKMLTNGQLNLTESNHKQLSNNDN